VSVAHPPRRSARRCSSRVGPSVLDGRMLPPLADLPSRPSVAVLVPALQRLLTSEDVLRCAGAGCPAIVRPADRARRFAASRLAGLPALVAGAARVAVRVAVHDRRDLRPGVPAHRVDRRGWLPRARGVPRARGGNAGREHVPGRVRPTEDPDLCAARVPGVVGTAVLRRAERRPAARADLPGRRGHRGDERGRQPDEERDDAAAARPRAAPGWSARRSPVWWWGSSGSRGRTGSI
jgi:hypothetical protein